MLYFINDYSEGAHEKVLQHLIDTNMHQPVIPMKKFHVHGNFIHMAIMMTCQCPHPVMQIMKGWTKPAS